MINLNTLNSCVKYNIKKIFYSSSACVYPERNQLDSKKILTVKKILSIRPILILNMGGKNCIVKDYI